MSPNPAADGEQRADQRAAFRAFVREHHPDRGGDPTAFAAGLSRFGRGAGPVTPACHRPPPNPGSDPGSSAGSAADRGEGPVHVVADLPLPVRVGVALIRTWRRRHRPRVR